jgi:transcriptional regulator with XRE-family HTH domain
MEPQCAICGGQVKWKLVHRYRDDEFLGVPGAILVDSVREGRCLDCGDRPIRIPDPRGLVVAAALARVQRPVRLRGREVRFLRGALGWQAKELAEQLGVRPETVSRWEAGKEVIGPTSEKLLRLLIGTHLAQEAKAVEYDAKFVASMRIKSAVSRKLKIEFHRVRRPRRREAWQPLAA